jgi:hypothetical protein
MRVLPADIAKRAGTIPGLPAGTGAVCAFLEACAYPGIAQLLEAAGDDRQQLDLARDVLGLDLQNVSCVFLWPGIEHEISERGRAFLRNVRHGLFLVPLSIRLNIAIGCPVDPAFGLGGERLHNPYAEKLEAADRDGVEVDDELWQRLADAAVT